MHNLGQPLYVISFLCDQCSCWTLSWGRSEASCCQRQLVSADCRAGGKGLASFTASHSWLTSGLLRSPETISSFWFMHMRLSVRKRQAAHYRSGVLSPTSSRPTGRSQIRLCLFSDLTGKREKKGYVKHIHMPGISICYTYTYALHLPILNICIKAGRPGGNNENRIHF